MLLDCRDKVLERVIPRADAPLTKNDGVPFTPLRTPPRKSLLILGKFQFGQFQ
jgi:hypothetical protein